MLKNSAKLISDELVARGFTIDEIDTSFYRATKDDLTFLGESSKTIVQSSVVMSACLYKDFTKKFLIKHEIPTSRFKVVDHDNLNEILDLEFPVVVKPLNLHGGEGVRIGLKDLGEVDQYFRETKYSKIIVEETLIGNDYRILIVNKKYFAACKRVPAFVVGDGIHNIIELINEENHRRIKKPESFIFPIRIDAELNDVISKFPNTNLFIPDSGQRVYVRRNANVSSGGVAVDVTDEVCISIRELCESIASFLGANTLGVDIMTNNINEPLDSQFKAGVVELNHSPALWLHTNPYIGKRRDPTKLIVDELLDYLNHNNF